MAISLKVLMQHVVMENEVSVTQAMLLVQLQTVKMTLNVVDSTKVLHLHPHQYQWNNT